MTLKDRLQTSVTQLESDSRLVHAWAHGNTSAVVTTEGGQVRSPAKLIADKDAEINATIDSLLSHVKAEANRAAASATLAAQEADAAATSADESDTAKTQAQASSAAASTSSGQAAAFATDAAESAADATAHATAAAA